MSDTPFDEPLKYVVSEELLVRLDDRLFSAIEILKDCLAEHDATTKRATRRDKSWAIELEREITLHHREHRDVRTALGFPYPLPGDPPTDVTEQT